MSASAVASGTRRDLRTRVCDVIAIMLMALSGSCRHTSVPELPEDPEELKALMDDWYFLEWSPEMERAVARRFQETTHPAVRSTLVSILGDKGTVVGMEALAREAGEPSIDAACIWIWERVGREAFASLPAHLRTYRGRIDPRYRGDAVRLLHHEAPSRTVLPAPVRRTEVAADGTFELPLPPSPCGILSVWLEHDAMWIPVRTAEYPSAWEWDMRIHEPERLRVPERDHYTWIRLVDEDGRPLVSVEASLVWHLPGQPIGPRYVTDARGEIRIGGIPYGLYALDARCPGKCPARFFLPMLDRPRERPVDFELVAAATVRIHVLSGTNGILYYPIFRSSGRTESERNFSMQLPRPGFYEVDVPAGRESMLRVACGDRKQIVTVSGTPGEVVSVEMK